MSLSLPSLALKSNVPLTAILATAAAGLATGSLCFGSAVDVRSFLTHLDNKKTGLIQQHFAVWWPYGRDWMVPVLVSGAVFGMLAFWETGHINFAYSGALVGVIAPYTAFILGEDIEALRKSDVKEVEATTKRFCMLHHPRTVLAATGFCLALLALADL